jgi:hypothetical protein
MTPRAPTSAGRRSTAARTGRRPSQAGDPGRRRALRRKPAPTAPRRVSGPSGGRARAAAGAAPAPARRRISILRLVPSRKGGLSLRARALAFVRSLPDHALLDRVVRGRAWIPLLGLMLAGIVAMQVEVLKLGASMGRAIEQGTALQSRNDLLRASVATLADDQRIERMAGGMGMVMPTPAEVGFLNIEPSNAQRAASNIHQPDASVFLSSLSALTASSNPASGATPGTTASTPSGATIPTQTATPTPPITQPSDSTGGAAATSGA